MLDRTISFFTDNIPSLRALVIGAPLGILWSYLCLQNILLRL